MNEIIVTWRDNISLSKTNIVGCFTHIDYCFENEQLWLNVNNYIGIYFETSCIH